MFETDRYISPLFSPSSGNIQLPSELVVSRNFSETPPYHCSPTQMINGVGGTISMNTGQGQQKEVKRRRLNK